MDENNKINGDLRWYDPMQEDYYIYKNYEKTTGRRNPYLILKHLPPQMTTKAIYNICSSHGKVMDVSNINKNQIIFVQVESVVDLEAIYRALEKNSYGFHIYIGKNFLNNVKNTSYNVMYDAIKKSPMASINLENRAYPASEKLHPRPNIKSTPHANYDYNSSNNLLHQSDPQKHFLIEEDSHELERAGLTNPNADLNKNSKYKFCTGRAYIEMSENTKSFISEKCNKSVGHFDNHTNVYTKGNRTEFKFITGNCAECNRICDIICSVCSEYYCGIECQRNAWPKHRNVCGKLKHLQKTSTSVKDESVAAVVKVVPKLPRRGNLVVVTAVNKQNTVFIRSKTYEDNFSFHKTISSIQDNVKNFKGLCKVSVCGQIVMTRCNGQYNRAMIINMDNFNNIMLIYISYGNIDTKLFEELIEAPIYYIELKSFTLPIILKNVADFYMTDEIRKLMYSYIKDSEVKLKYNTNYFIEADGVYQVELIDNATNQNFNKLIADNTKPLVNDKVYFKNQLLPEGQNVELVVMDNSFLCTGCISCTTVECALEIHNFQEELQEYAKSLEKKSYTPCVDELCIAKSNEDQKWYRGRCIDFEHRHPTIFFFDFGNIALINVDDIRCYPKHLSFANFTFDCEIDGLPEYCDDKIVSILKDLIPKNRIIKCDNVEVFEEYMFYVIKLHSIIKKLRCYGLLD